MTKPDDAIYSETVQIGRGRFTIRVTERGTGFVSQWRCERCDELGGNPGTCESLELALQEARANAGIHDAILHHGYGG